MRVVIITGSRHWARQPPIAAAIAAADMVMHGGARGADEVADRVARSLSLDRLVMPAHWADAGAAAGPQRNERMAARAAALAAEGHEVQCFAFPLPDSVGTWDCVERMRKHGIPVTVYRHEQWRAAGEDPLEDERG